MPSIQIKILGGLPVEVDFDLDDMGVHINEFYKVTTKFRTPKLGQWVWNRIEAIPGELERIEQTVFDDYMDDCKSAAGADAYDRMMDRKMGY